MTTKNIMIIGIGFHARRIYIPKIIEYSKKMPVKLVCGVDLSSQSDVISRYMLSAKYNFDIIYLDNFDASNGLTANVINKLDNLVSKYAIDAVVISTEPLAHKAYALWALSRGLHILMDKPITIRRNISTEQTEAKLLIDDYLDLLAVYKDASLKKNLIFSINVQRRYDNGFNKVLSLIREVRDRFNVPVTSIQAMHADGTWVFPQELINQESHPYKYGYGKCAHSGYHIFDIVWQMYKTSVKNTKAADSLEILTSSLNPDGFNTCINEEDYVRYFGMQYDRTGLTGIEYENKVADYGEIDSFSIIRLLKNNKNICNISISLLHSSFSRRAWAVANDDLYKGNGRVKQQQFIIQQGPFQSIHIHNYQSKDKHDIDNSNEFDIGGNNHFDIYIFRNVGMFGGEEAFRKISIKDLEVGNMQDLVVESTKGKVIMEFINFILGNLRKDELKSNIDTHDVPVKILSGIYQSSARLRRGKNPLVNIKL